jgi:hypothetical protein
MMDWLSICNTKDMNQVHEAIKVLDVNERDKAGRTPLMLFLTYRMPLETIELLIEHGADIEAEDKLRDSVLKKAIKFKQKDAIFLLLEHGVQLDSPKGITATAWYYAKENNQDLADMLLATKGSVRSKLTPQEQEIVDELLYEEDLTTICDKVKTINSAEILHAFVNEFNWDDDPTPMELVATNPACMEVTLHDMYKLLEGDMWLEMNQVELEDTYEGKRYQRMALMLKEKLETDF